VEQETGCAKEAHESRAQESRISTELSPTRAIRRASARAGPDFGFAVALAWRGARASRRKFILAVILMAAGAATSFGVRSIADGFADRSEANAREWIAADAMAVYFGRAPAPEQWKSVEELNRALDFTLVVEMPVLASSDQAPDLVRAEAKVVNPDTYPYYGQIKGKTGRLLRSLLGTRSVLVSEDLLKSLQLPVGGKMRINQIEFTIADVIATEPDRFATPPVPMGRLIISRDAMEQTGLLQPDTLGLYRILLRIPPALDRQTMCRRLEDIFPDAQVIDYTSRTPETNAMVNWVIPFLDLTAFLSLVVGAFGIAAAVHFHLLRSMDTIAILKALGATTRRIIGAYSLQVMGLALAGSVIGIACGRVVESALGQVTVQYMGAQISGAHRIRTALEIGLFSLWVALVAAWIPLSRIRFVSAAVLLRRDTGEKLQTQRTNLATSRFVAAVVLLLLAMSALVIFQPAGSWREQGLLLITVSAAALLLNLAGRISIVVLYRVARSCNRRLPWSVKHALFNLYRYRRQSYTVIPVLAGSIAFITVALLGARHLQTYVLQAIPFHTPNLLFIHVEKPRREQLAKALRDQIGVEGSPRFIPTVWVELSSSGALSLESLRSRQPGGWIQRGWPASCSDSLPDKVEVVSGHWWDSSGQADHVALSEELAALFDAHLGDQLHFFSGRRMIDARLSAVVRIPPVQRAWWREIVFNCGALPDARYSGAATIAPSHLIQVRLLLRQLFPDLIVLDLDDLLARTGQIGREALDILTFIGIFIAGVAGLLLVATMNSIRAFRLYDIAIMRALGANKRTVQAVLTLEFLTLGLVAGLAGGVVGSAATSLFLMHAAGILVSTFDPWAIMIVTLTSAVVAALVARLASRSWVRPKPLEILRRQ
jgi:putative ABC transport system permease protein